MRVDELATPRDDAELYDLEEEALRLRPYMTGDVFAAVEAAADEEPLDVMIIGHPCVIRGAHGKLMTRVPCCVLAPTERKIPYDTWPAGNFDKFPLCDAIRLGPNQAARLLELRSVHHKQLARARRHATLTERGVYILQQRFTHAMTRCAVPVADFEKATRHVMREAEFEYEWVAELNSDPADEAEIRRLVRDFHKLLDAGGNRDLLLRPGGESELRAIVRREIKDRLAGPGDAAAVAVE